MPIQRPLSPIELVLVIVALLFGTWSIPFYGDWQEATYFQNHWVFVPIRFVSAALLFLVSSYVAGVAKGVRVAAALWGAIGCNTVFPSFVPYLGFVLLPLEIISAGLLFAFRSSLPTWKAVGIAAMVELIVLGTLEPDYVGDMVTW